MTASAHEDKIWTDAARKLEGIRRDVEEARGDGLNVLVVAHFKSAAMLCATTRGMTYSSASEGVEWTSSV